MENGNTRIITLEKGTDIGFSKEEIKNTATGDLLNLRKSVMLYLKSKKLKKRNGSFVEVYQRINEELYARKHISHKVEESFKKGFVKVEMTPKTTSDGLSTSVENEENQEIKPLLQRKRSNALELFIPSFLNDKKQSKCHIKEKRKSDELEKPAFRNSLNEFGKGLFDIKMDFDHSDDIDSFKIVKKPSFEVDLKEIEIKSVMFNAVPEDLFFTLD